VVFKELLAAQNSTELHVKGSEKMEYRNPNRAAKAQLDRRAECRKSPFRILEKAFFSRNHCGSVK
jgi:hypothetical protein